MKLTLTDLNVGISWWLTEKVKNKWPRDFHNSDYYQIYEIRKDGLTHDWWRSTVDRLWNWRAIRSRTAPNTKAEIETRGIQVLEPMNELYSRLLASANGEPLFLNFDWRQIAELYHLLAGIKGSSSSVFPSKLGHFIFPKLFVITDNEATNAQPYEVFWSSMRKAWHDFDEWETAKQILLTQITEQRDREIHGRYPLEIKVIELCSIGRKHRSTQGIVAPNNHTDETRAKPRTGGVMAQTQFKATIRGTGETPTGGLEPLTVDVEKSEANGLPYHPLGSSRLSPPFDLLIENDSYQAFFRTSSQHVYITRHLKNLQNHQETTLAKILPTYGFKKNQRVLLSEENGSWRLSERFVD